MRYGEKLRECRVARGWSRGQLENVVLSRFQRGGITKDAVKAIELGVTVFPYDTTRKILGLVFPELAEWEAKNTPDYPSELKKAVLQQH